MARVRDHVRAVFREDDHAAAVVCRIPAGVGVAAKATGHPLQELHDLSTRFPVKGFIEEPPAGVYYWRGRRSQQESLQVTYRGRVEQHDVPAVEPQRRLLRQLSPLNRLPQRLSRSCCLLPIAWQRRKAGSDR